jgi:hypothetical protein
MPSFPARRNIALLLAGVLVLVLLFYASLPNLDHGGANDDDTTMRLAFLAWDLPRGLLMDYHFPRDGAPYGMTIHWTLPYDLYVAALAAVPAIFLGWHQALSLAALVGGPLMLLADIAAALSLASAIGARKAHVWVVAMFAASPMLFIYAQIGKVDHHPMSLACATMAMSAAIRAARSPSRVAPGVWAAFWAVLAGWVSMETFATIVAAWAVVLAGSALRRRQDSFRAFACSLIVFSLAAFVIDPPPDHVWELRVDRWSLFHVFAFLIMAAAVALAPFIRGGGRPTTRLLRTTIPAIVPALFLVGFAVHAVSVYLPDPTVFSYYTNNIAESKPAWSNYKFLIVAMWPTLPGLLALAILVYKSRRRPRVLIAFMFLGILACEAALGLYFIRLTPYATLLSAVFIGAIVDRFILRHRRFLPMAPTILQIVLLCALIPIAAWEAVGAFHAGYHDTGACVIREPALAALRKAVPPGSIVMSEVWMSPEILWATDLRTVAGPYHTNASGLYDVAHTFTGTDPGVISAILRKRQAKALVMCNGPHWASGFASDTLEYRLMLGLPVGGLTPIPFDGDPTIKLFLFDPPARKTK